MRHLIREKLIDVRVDKVNYAINKQNVNEGSEMQARLKSFNNGKLSKKSHCNHVCNVSFQASKIKRDKTIKVSNLT